MKSLARDTLIYGISAILSRGLALLILPIYTRVLPPNEYGALDLILVIGTLAVIVVPMEISQAVARLFNDADGPDERRLMASTALWFTVATYLAALIVSLVAAPWIAQSFLGGSSLTNVFRLGAAFIAANGIFYFLQNQLRFELRSTDYAVLSTIYAGLTLTFGIAFGFGFRLGLPGIVTAQLLAALVSVTIGAAQLRRSFALTFDRATVRVLLSFSLPLVPSGLATFLTLYGNRLLLNSMLGLEAVGLFGVAVRLANTAALPIVGFQAALTPLVYAHYKEAETPRSLARIFEGFLAAALCCCIVLGLFAGEVLKVFAEPKYVSAARFLIALAPATILSQAYIFFPGIAIARKTHLQLAILAASAVVSLALNWLLIKGHGLPGAALATLFGALFFFSCWVWRSQRLYPLPINWGKVGLAAAAFAVTATGGAIIQSASLSDTTNFSLRLGLLILFLALLLVTGLARITDLGKLVQRSRRP